VLTIAHRKAIDHVRRRRGVTPVADVPDRAAPPVSTRDEEVWSHVRELPAKQRMAVALRYFVDAGYDEISTLMGTSEEAARRNVHEGLKRLRTEYQR
jgi:RNA polymerase sigma-70 factor (ECF subfamily)